LILERGGRHQRKAEKKSLKRDFLKNKAKILTGLRSTNTKWGAAELGSRPKMFGGFLKSFLRAFFYFFTNSEKNCEKVFRGFSNPAFFAGKMSSK